MFRALLISAIIGAAAYHYGVEAGKKDARAELSQSLSTVQLHHHARHHKTAGREETSRPNFQAEDGVDGAVTSETQLLEHKATNAVTATLKAQAADTLHQAVGYIEKKLNGEHADSEWAPDAPAAGR